jgi:thiamine transporter ThiT
MAWCSVKAQGKFYVCDEYVYIVIHQTLVKCSVIQNLKSVDVKIRASFVANKRRYIWNRMAGAELFSNYFADVN